MKSLLPVAPFCTFRFKVPCRPLIKADTNSEDKRVDRLWGLSDRCSLSSDNQRVERWDSCTITVLISFVFGCHFSFISKSESFACHV